MRTSIDLPDSLFRRTKASAASRGMSLKQFISQALERELKEAGSAPETAPQPPLLHLRHNDQFDPASFPLDDLLT